MILLIGGWNWNHFVASPLPFRIRHHCRSNFALIMTQSHRAARKGEQGCTEREKVVALKIIPQSLEGHVVETGANSSQRVVMRSSGSAERLSVFQVMRRGNDVSGERRNGDFLVHRRNARRKGQSRRVTSRSAHHSVIRHGPSCVISVLVFDFDIAHHLLLGPSTAEHTF
jgi:hypothetical protein